MSIFTLLIIAISLSMDTFSLSIVLGNYLNNRKYFVFFPVIVAFFHLIMPIFGYSFRLLLIKEFNINSNIMLFLVFLFLLIEMIIDLFSKDKKVIIINLTTLIFLALSVSIDSFTLSFGLNEIKYYPLIFMIISGIFTYVGLILGKFSYSRLGNYSKILGIIIILYMCILHFFKCFV